VARDKLDHAEAFGARKSTMSPATRLSIENVNRTFEEAIVARDMSRLDAVYTSGARILPPGGEMVSGLEAIKEFWGNAVAGLDVKAVSLQTVDFELAGETGYEIGRAVLEFAAEGASPMSAKYVVVWKQQPDGWRWHVDIWNPNA
jgi:ketosteroid isomerase-like protein